MGPPAKFLKKKYSTVTKHQIDLFFFCSNVTTYKIIYKQYTFDEIINKQKTFQFTF